MCEPTTIALAVTTVAGLASAAYAANEQKSAINDAAEVQQKQVDDQASLQTDERVREAREARARARVSAAEAGVMGNSVDAVMSDIMFQSGRDVSIIEKNRQNGIAASETERRARVSGVNAELISSFANTGARAYSAFNSTKAINSAPRRYTIEGD